MRDDSVRATCVDTDSITLASKSPGKPCQPMETALLLVQLDTGENLQGLAPYGEQTPDGGSCALKLVLILRQGLGLK
ncbi:hypothetical protein CGCSCA4_v010092 [Colletotrichum siamense]|uniref:Uncharacterized protein n=1 Tax=Colletotrichum siamense TaxID=690259 RepID=A0A9P5EPT2_COLSI|nr:hypothetical protein CGCSCA4_v010092 [Colletotrichum siamense]KAF4857368.1 hypothetical protein CGCSCA2_v008319 [Colletotrichum siamense]